MMLTCALIVLAAATIRVWKAIATTARLQLSAA
jgi:hypothetical protein